MFNIYLNSEMYVKHITQNPTIMKTLLITLMMFSFTSVEEYVAEQIAQECRATIESNDLMGTRYVVVAQPPGYYSEDLVERGVYEVTRRYIDVEVARHWERDIDDGSINIVLVVADNYILVRYAEYQQRIYISWLY